MTFGEMFVEQFVSFRNDANGLPRKAYLWCKVDNPLHLRDPKRYLMPGITRQFRTDETKSTITYEVRIRFSKALANCKDNIPRVYIILNQMLTEEAIKEFFYTVWREWHNVTQRKIAAIEANNRNREFKKLSFIERVNKKEIYNLTRRMSLREAAKSSTVLCS